ncbi:MAG TPA: hypothetical protein VFJ05_07085, partial [Nitrososphaeraceae archaeon]|nr:hypothetical protein [Nitrososphaeraceae archaeon]
MSRHEGTKRCPECRHDSMKFHDVYASWICNNCANRVREDFYQTILPSTRELETDEIQPDNLTTAERTPMYFKSIKLGSTEQDYESSVNQGPLGSDNAGNNKYVGSANSALRQDSIKFQ